MSIKLKPLRIGDLEIKIPIIQGAMGIKVSTFSLAAAVTICAAIKIHICVTGFIHKCFGEGLFRNKPSPVSCVLFLSGTSY